MKTEDLIGYQVIAVRKGEHYRPYLEDVVLVLERPSTGEIAELVEGENCCCGCKPNGLYVHKPE